MHTSHPELYPLKKHLFDSLGGFADKRVKNLDKGNLFFADDRGRSDYGADKKLFYWFCAITVSVVAPDRVQVSLSGGVPCSEQIEEWAASNCIGNGKRFDFEINASATEPLVELAILVASIVRPGAPRYKEKAYKYSCPRVSKSLRGLAAVLDSFAAI